LHRETAEAKAQGIIAQELKRLGWSEGELGQRARRHADKMEVAARVQRDATLPMKWIAARLGLGTWKSTAPRLGARKRSHRAKENVQ
jgi:hypothetical protein